jgi:hypothetical protein
MFAMGERLFGSKESAAEAGKSSTKNVITSATDKK